MQTAGYGYLTLSPKTRKCKTLLRPGSNQGYQLVQHFEKPLKTVRGWVRIVVVPKPGCAPAPPAEHAGLQVHTLRLRATEPESSRVLDLGK